MQAAAEGGRATDLLVCWLIERRGLPPQRAEVAYSGDGACGLVANEDTEAGQVTLHTRLLQLQDTALAKQSPVLHSLRQRRAAGSGRHEHLMHACMHALGGGFSRAAIAAKSGTAGAAGGHQRDGGGRGSACGRRAAGGRPRRAHRARAVAHGGAAQGGGPTSPAAPPMPPSLHCQEVLDCLLACSGAHMPQLGCAGRKPLILSSAGMLAGHLGSWLLSERIAEPAGMAQP
jgi:hypothetical protein